MISQTPNPRHAMTKKRRGLLLLLLVISLALVACDSFVLYEELDAASPTADAADGDQGREKDNGDDGGDDGDSSPPELTITPVSVVIEKNRTIDFDASGGEPEYVFTVAAGDGSIEPDTGLYAAPGVDGSATIRVTDGTGATAEASVTILDSGSTALQISPVSVSIEGSQTVDFAASGGVPGYTFSIVSGGGTIETDTGLYTAPATAGSATVRVADSSGAFADAEVTVLDSAPPPLTIVPATAAAKVTETIAFAASGGHGGYVFSLESGGGTVDPVSGLYTAPSSAGGAIVRVTDAGGATADATVTILVPAELRIYPETVTVNVEGTYTFAATGGTTPYTYSVQNDQSGAAIAGPHYTAGENQGTDIIRVADNSGNQAFASVTVVPAGVLVINPTNPRVEEGGSLQFAGAGGTPGYLFTINSGAGSIIAGTGVYTAPPTVGTDVSEVQIEDSVGGTETTLVDVVPRAPTNLVADGAYPGPKTVMLTWEDNSANEDGYRIERRTSTGAYTEIHETSPDATSYLDDDNGLDPNTLYIYRVYAFTNDPLQSEHSNEGYDLPNAGG